MKVFIFAREGYPFIFGSALITVIAQILLIITWKSGNHDVVFFLLFLLYCVSLGMTILMVIFFRDPERKIPAGEDTFVSPADGKVILIKEVNEGEYLKAPAKEISIFMSLVDVHVNRAPCDGKVSIIEHTPGKFMVAHKEKASIENENVVMVLEGKERNIMVRQVAGFIARRIICKVKPGDVLRRGERYGMIKFGSRLDVYLPKDTRIMVKVGDKVKAGETILGGL